MTIVYLLATYTDGREHQVAKGIQGREAALTELEKIRAMEAKMNRCQESEAKAKGQLAEAQHLIRRLEQRQRPYI